MPATGYCRLNVYICIMYECLLLQVIIYEYCYKDNSSLQAFNESWCAWGLKQRTPALHYDEIFFA